MFQRKFKALSGNKVLFNRRGQVSLLFALMMPIFLLMIGVVLDLGWYYLNVSRLQNAADAAAVAGANALREDEYFRDYKNIKLIGKYPAKDSNKYRVDSIYELTAIENTNVIAEEYVAKNLSSNEDTIINSWTKTEVKSDEELYTKDNNLYYVVKLKERIRHFFLPGWFDDMTAPVTAVALLSKTAIKGDSEDSEENPTMPTMPTSTFDFDDSVLVEPEALKEIEKVLNENMIIGNWEVQNTYKSLNNTPDYLKDEYGDIIADPNTGAVTMITNFQSRFGYAVYSARWNHFQDIRNDYKVAGATYRTETINVWDDVKDTDGDGSVDAWGKEKNGGESDVLATKASSNPDKEGDKGKPYTWDKLDSINIDFSPEITFTEITNEDWDFRLGYLTTSCKHQDGNTYRDWTAAQGTDVKNIGILRIHSTINIGKPYQERTDEACRDKDVSGNLLPDILWGRIESEPMLFYPDNVNDKFTAKDSKVGVKRGLSSVRQIIINVKESNCNKGDNTYRPVILFYDGPETNDIYDSYKNRTDVLHNKSLPVILNLNADFRGVLYAPNSPVVVIGNKKDNFDGFVVAKEYKRLKTTKDFEDELKVDSGKYTRYEGDGKIVFTENEKVDNPYYVADSSHYASGYVAEPEKINWKYTQIEENGIKMYVDNYGNVQYMDYPDAPTKYGTYDNFGRTTFATHGYTVLKTSANNMLISGR